MRVTMLLLVAGCMHLSATSLSQTITLRANQQPITKVFETIERQTGYQVIYSDRFIQSVRSVTIVADQMPLSDFLENLLTPAGLSYQIKETTILIAKAKPDKKAEEADQAREALQNRLIYGIVTDQNGNPLERATVTVKDTTLFTVTNRKGNYKISLPGDRSSLVFTIVGFESKEQEIGESDIVNIMMLPSIKGLDEVVVVGYGTKKSVNLTGAVSTLGSEQITSRPATNVTSLLQGQLPGVTISQSSGLPGLEGTSMLIRGLGTMNNSQPLVIVDGMESDMNDINPYDVETISVLKDAASASIYGSRAANGVVLITTKRGRQGTPIIAYNAYAGWQDATRLPSFLESAEYAKLLNEANRNEGIPPRYTEEEIRLYETGEDPYNYPNVDWYGDFLEQSGFTQNHNLRVSGGMNQYSRYSISLGFNEQEALIKRGVNKRYNIRANWDNRLSEHITTGLNFAVSRRYNSMPTAPFSGNIGTIFHQMLRIPPTQLNKYENGTWARHLDGNPNAWIEEGGSNVIRTDHLIGSIFAEVALIKDLSLKVRAGLDQTLRDQKIKLHDITYGDGSYQGPNSVGEYLNRDRIHDIEALLNYETTFFSHGISGFVGASSRSEFFSYTNAGRRDLPSNQLSALNAGSPEGMNNSGSDSEVKLSSAFGRLNYEFDDKYLFESNLRIDGSSKFAKGNRWGVFPSFSAGWIVSREDFINSADWLSLLKIRASWGKLGNHRISDYLFMPLISLGQNYSFGGTVADGASQTAANNPDISWEVTTEKNIGLDLQFFQHTLSASVDIYERYTDDILTYVPVSEFFGLPAPIVNAGAMSNKGVEAKVGLLNAINTVKYDVSLNVAFNKNKVERFENPSIGDFLQIEGESWNSLYGYEWIGYFYSDEEAANSPVHHPNVRAGDLKFKDQNNDNLIDGDDRIVLGNTIPEITFGLNLGMAYRRFDFRAFFQGADRVYRRLSDRGQWPFVNAGKAMDAHLDRMIVEDGKVVTEGYFPRTLVQFNHHNAEPQNSFHVHDAAYIRLKNLQIGYSLPRPWMNAGSISNARIYFSGQNLLTFTRAGFPDYADPEAADGMGGGEFYPQVKIYTLGIDISF